MVGFSGFFGGGAAEQSLKEDTLGVQEDRLALFREQLQQKASDASMQQKLDEIKAGEGRLAAFDALAKKTGAPAMTEAANRQRALIQQLRVSMGETPQGAQDVSALNQAIAQEPPPGKPFTLSPGQTRFGPTGEPVARVDEPPPSAEGVTSELLKVANSARQLLTATSDPVLVRKMLETIQSQATDQRVISGIGALIRALPATSEDFGKTKGKAALAAKLPIIDELTEILGGQRELAAAIAIGPAAAGEVRDPAKFTQAETAKLRDDIKVANSVIRTVQNIIPDVDDDTVSVIASINRQLAPGQQIPGVKEAINVFGKAFGVGGEAKVRKAVVAHARFQQAIGPLARFISDKGGRLSNEDREFAASAVGLFNLAADATAAREILTRLVTLAENVRSSSTDDLARGRIQPRQETPTVTPPPAAGGAPELRLGRDAAGNLVEIDAAGNPVEGGVRVTPVQ